MIDVSEHWVTVTFPRPAAQDSWGTGDASGASTPVAEREARICGPLGGVTEHGVVGGAIDVKAGRVAEERPTYDISAIDFDRLKREFERSRSQRTAVQALKHTVEQRLRRLLARNPLRTDFQQHYEEIVAAYNREKDRVTIEQTFEELLRFVQELEEEENRAVREGLDEESLAIFDLLKKPDLDRADDHVAGA